MSTTLTPHAAALHRLAAFINDNDLPGASINIHADQSIIGFAFHDVELAENAFWRYAQALDFPVIVKPHEDEQGCATELLSANGHRDGVFYICQLVRPVLATVPA